MKKPIRLKAKSTHQGIVLLEALVAVLLFSMGVLALVGLQAAMMKNTEDAKYRSEASYIAQQTLGQVWLNPADPGALSTNASGVSIAKLLPEGRKTVTVNTNADNVSEVTVRIDWKQPGKDPHHFSTTAMIAGG